MKRSGSLKSTAAAASSGILTGFGKAVQSSEAVNPARESSPNILIFSWMSCCSIISFLVNCRKCCPELWD